MGLPVDLLLYILLDILRLKSWLQTLSPIKLLQVWLQEVYELRSTNTTGVSLAQFESVKNYNAMNVAKTNIYIKINIIHDSKTFGELL